ncbi:MAG: cell division protein ZapA [Spirochaetes bacterium]|nr:cell division protein ZapA [Spirochaetota bacterium]
MENKVKVEIYGHSYTINGEAPAEYIQQIADYVDKKMREVSSANPGYNLNQTAILVALNIADEYFQMKKITSGIEGVMEKKTMALISMLDEGLIGDYFHKAESIHQADH